VTARLYDISPRVDTRTPVWPGDTPFVMTLDASMAEGSATNVGQVRGTSHLGAHVDAPFHTEEHGTTVDQLPLGRFWGPCWLVEVAGQDGRPVERVEPRHVSGLDFRRAPRVLFRTASVADPTVFPTRCASLTVDLVEDLARCGVVLVGLDTPSVDRLDALSTAGGLEVHRALNRHGISNLENLALDGVPPGLYEICALPLPWVGLDASPVRAALRPLPPEA
jgi:arylformamidase